MQELLARQSRPDPLERPLELWRGANDVGQFTHGIDLVDAFANEALVVLIRQPVRQLAANRGAALIVVPRTTTRPFHRLFGVARLQHRDAPTNRYLHVLFERTLTGTQGAREEAGHSQVTLQLIDRFGIATADLHVGHETRDRRERHTGLTE